MLHEEVDIQLIVMPFIESSREQTRQLTDAAMNNDLPTLERLLQRPQNPNHAAVDFDFNTPLVAAAAHGRLEAVHMLLEACADKDLRSVEGGTAMYAASRKGHLEVVRLLLEVRADKDKETPPRTPMWVASFFGHVEIVRLLLDAGADKNKASPICAACRVGHREIVRLLLEAKADKEKADSSGHTPMLLAREKRNSDIVQLLLDDTKYQDPPCTL